MKKLLLLTLLLLVFTTYAEEIKTIDKVIDHTADAVTKVYNNGSTIVNKASEATSKIAPKIESALNTLGHQLKVSADRVWDILIRQQLVWSICYLMLTLASIGSVIHLIWRCNNNNKRAFKKAEDGYGNKVDGRTEWQDADCVIFVFSLGAWIALSSLSILNFSDMMTGFINPEYGALKTITEIVIQIK